MNQGARNCLAIAMVAGAIIGCLLPGMAAARSGTTRDISCERYLNSKYILAHDAEIIHRRAMVEKVAIFIIAPQPDALDHSTLKTGVRAKTGGIMGLCKSNDSGIHAGWVACPPHLFNDDENAFRAAVKELANEGYTVLGPEDGYLVVNEKGDRYYSDYDLLGVYDQNTGSDAYSEALRHRLNDLLGRRIIRHGPRDQYSQRLEKPFRLPVLAFLPDGRFYEILSLRELAGMYSQLGIQWPGYQEPVAPPMFQIQPRPPALISPQ